MLCFYAGPLLICMMAWLLLTLLAQTRETSASAVGGFFLEEQPAVKEIDQASCHQDTMIKKNECSQVFRLRKGMKNGKRFSLQLSFL